MRRSLLLILLITISFVSNALGASPENPLLRELGKNAVVTVLSKIQADVGSRHKTLVSTGGAGVTVYFRSVNATVLNPGDHFKIEEVMQRATGLILVLDNQSIENIHYIMISRFEAETMTVSGFNQLMQGKLSITLNDNPEEPEGRPIHQLELPAKIKFEEEQRLLPQETKLTFNHPTKMHTKIVLHFKEKSGRTRVISKGTVFEIVDAEFKDGPDTASTTTVLRLNSKDIHFIECQASGHAPFTTSDFYSFMGSKASLIQNTDPPLPIE